DDDHAAYLAGSAHLSMLMLRSGRPGPIPTPQTAAAFTPDAQQARVLDQIRRAMISGGPQSVADRVAERMSATGADELMVTTNVHDHDERKASYTRLAHALLTSSG